jgi:hypothetical protein
LALVSSRAMIATLLAAGLLAAAPTQKPKLAVLDLTPGAGVDAALTTPIVEAITAEVQRRGYFEVLSQRDIATLLGVERQKQLIGCTEQAGSCMTELSGALGARFVLSGTLARLGEAYQLTLNALDTQKAQPLGRSTKLAKDLDTLQLMIPYAVAEATTTPAPAPPSRVLPITLIGVGATAIVMGLLLGTLALNTQGQIQGELEAGATQVGVLKSRDYYAQQLATVDRNKYIAVGCLVGGAALAIVGRLIMPKDIGAAQVALVPTSQGGALVGVFP